MDEAPKRKWVRAAFVCVACGGTFMGALLARRLPPDKAIVAGILVALMPASLLALWALCERMNWQFSLRMLLITMTLVAVVLGIIAALM